MSSQTYPEHGFVIEITLDNLLKLKLEHDLIERVMKYLREEDLDLDQTPVGLELQAAMLETHGLEPDLLYIRDDCDVSQGVELEKPYMRFFMEQKFTQTIRPEFEALPIEPAEAAWTIYG